MRLGVTEDGATRRPRETVLVDWRPHNRRAKSLAEDLGAELRLAPPVLRRKLYAPLRYVYLSLWTAGIFLRMRPSVIVASAPPPFCAILAFAYSRLFTCAYIVDAHHLATTGYWSRLPFGFWFNRLVMNRSLTTLVHNEAIQSLAGERGVNATVLETKVPALHPGSVHPLAGSFRVLVPCSFDPDEPIAQLWMAASQLGETTFYVTGDHARLDTKTLKAHPDNVVLTGFVSEAEYDGMLNSVDAVLALTTEDYPVRPRAASDAIAAEKPLVASRNEATRQHLGTGAILIGNTQREIVEGLSEVRRRHGEYQLAMKRLKSERMRQYQLELQVLKRILADRQVPK